jgi:hypothetical protein
MASRAETQNRKLMKGLIARTVGAEETLELVDIGTPMSATELAEFSKKAIGDVYKRALLTAPAAAVGAGRMGKRVATAGYQNKFDEIERYAVLVSDKAVRIIPVTTKSKMFGVEYIAREDIAAIEFPREGVSLELGDVDTTTFYGQKSQTIEVVIHGEGSEPVVLKMFEVDSWRELASRQ